MLEYIRNLNITGMEIGLLVLFFAACFLCGMLGSRKDAVRRSKAVISGQVVEQLAPLFPDFPCSVRDAKFLGQPIDYVAFVSDPKTGLIDEVLFIEVKTGGSTLSPREKSLKKAVKQGRVRYVEWRGVI